MGTPTTSAKALSDESASRCAQASAQNIDVLGLGCTAVDDLLYVPTYPPKDSKIRVRQHQRQCGGLTATALVAATRMGARCAYAGTLGHNDLSHFVERQLGDQGIDLRYVRRQVNARPVHSTIIVDEAQGSRTILFDVDDVGEAVRDWPPEEVIRAAKVLFVDPFGIEGMIRAAQIASAEGIPVVADFENVRAHKCFADLVALVNHLLVPVSWAQQWTNHSSPGEAAESLWNQARQAVVVTCGDQGCWYVGDDRPRRARHQTAYRVDVVDTTGCGDTFHGVYAAALSQGLSLGERVRLASAAAAMKARHPGGQAGIPTRSSVDAFVRNYEQ
jgi:sulfofructose kinase